MSSLPRDRCASPTSLDSPFLFQAKLEGSFSRIFGIIGSNTTNSTTPVQWYNEAGPYIAAGLYALIVVPLLVVSFLALWSVQAPDRFLKPKKA